MGCIELTKSFNSLQTGNHIQSWQWCADHGLDWVSIPFKRETISKGGTGIEVRHCVAGFNSLQTGNHIQSKTRFLRKQNQQLFQFPSNGKPYPKSTTPPPKCELYWVGFNSLQTGNHIQRLFQMNRFRSPCWFRFNSLQTGNHIQRRVVISAFESLNVFQFPSNGKPYPKPVKQLLP